MAWINNDLIKVGLKVTECIYDYCGGDDSVELKFEDGTSILYHILLDESITKGLELEYGKYNIDSDGVFTLLEKYD
jgi:hypothetical protein